MRSSSRHDTRIHRIAGQVAAIERSVLSEALCADTLHIVSAVRGAVAALMDELIQEYLSAQVAARDITDAELEKAAAKLATVLRRYTQ